MKVAVIGYSGSGKSTLAKKLGRIYQCPVLHLDRINFEPGWRERDPEDARRTVSGFWMRTGRTDGSLTEIIPVCARSGD